MHNGKKKRSRGKDFIAWEHFVTMVAFSLRDRERETKVIERGREREACLHMIREADRRKACGTTKGSTQVELFG